MVALGVTTGALFSNDDDLVDEIMRASDDSFETMWPMPITDEHREDMKGKYSDLNNDGYAYPNGGSCTAAAYLERFIEEGTQWAHLDICGPVMAQPAKPPICADMTGFGASLLLHFLT